MTCQSTNTSNKINIYWYIDNFPIFSNKIIGFCYTQIRNQIPDLFQVSRPVHPVTSIICLHYLLTFCICFICLFCWGYLECLAMLVFFWLSLHCIYWFFYFYNLTGYEYKLGLTSLLHPNMAEDLSFLMHAWVLN